MIVFPMAGLSRRFADAGYTMPKYMLPLERGVCFDYSVMGFLEAYADESFLFIMRDVFGTPGFVEDRLRALGLKRYQLVVLDGPTSGQGETVEKGLQKIGCNEGELTIFNIDTFRTNVTRLPREQRGDGILEVFDGTGDSWSFVEPVQATGNRVARTTEKDPISNLCCTGLYSFASASDFLSALARERCNPTSPHRETFIAPIYNQLIRANRDIRYHLIPSSEVLFCGIPAEYEALLSNPAQLQRWRTEG